MCPGCGLPVSGNKLYHGAACRQAAFRKRKGAKHVCDYCHSPTNKLKYCSARCKQAAYRDRKKRNAIRNA